MLSRAQVGLFNYRIYLLWRRAAPPERASSFRVRARARELDLRRVRRARAPSSKVARGLDASAAPPVRHPNVYGIDMPAVNEFIANGRSIEEINQTIGSDRLFYQTLEDLIDVTLQETSDVKAFDASCFNGEYITGDIDDAYLQKLYDARNDAAKGQSHVDDAVIDLHNDEAL